MSSRRDLPAALRCAVLAAAMCAAGRGVPAAAEAGAEAGASARLAALEAGRQAFVRVVVKPKWSEDLLLEAWGAEADADDEQWGQHGHAPTARRINDMMDLLAQKRSAEMTGAILAPGVVGVFDDGTVLEWKLAGRIEVVDAAGRRLEARLDGCALRAPVTLLRLGEPDAAPGPAYVEGFVPSAAEPVDCVTLESDPEDDGRQRLVLGSAAAPFAGKPVTAAAVGYIPGPRNASPASAPGPALLVDRTGRPVGVRFGGADVAAENRSRWDVKAMLADAVPEKQLAAARVAAQHETLKLSPVVRFEFRPPDPDADDAGRQDAWGWEVPAEDTEAYGFAVGGGRVLIPRAMHPGLLRQVDRISVLVGTDWKPARFLAACRAFEAMLIEVPGAQLGRPAGLAEGGAVDASGPLVFGHGSNAGGLARGRTGLFRVTGRRRGYGDRLWPEAPGLPVGSLIFDLDGKPVGLSLLERRERRLADIAAGTWADSDPGMLALAGFDTVRKLLADPGAEPGWRPMSREEAGRLIWLGVEFDPVTPELATGLGAELETRSGGIGLVVSAVYPGSPAEKLGLAPQDILLRLEVEGLGEPLPLLTSYLEYAGEYGPEDADGGDAEAEPEEDQEEIERAWCPRFNFLTELLTEAGPGRKAKLTFFSSRDRAAREAAFELAWAPPDYDSARAHTDDELGLSVKPVTYDVRHALSLPAGAPGVVISRVEPGAPAQLARLSRYMLITQVEGAPVASPEDFAAAVAKARAAKLGKVKLQVSAMGKSRFADLTLGE